MFDSIKSIWADFVEFMKDLPIVIFSGILDAAAYVFESMPVPDFISGQSLGAILGPSFDSIGYFLSAAGIDSCLAMVLSATVFRVMRKILTLGKW